MERTESTEKPAEAAAEVAPALLPPSKQTIPDGGSCPTCSGSSTPRPSPLQNSFVYALGRIEPRFPRLSVEKEFAQAAGQIETAGLTDAQTLVKTLSESRNQYLARQLCWVMMISGLETYLVVPRQPSDVILLVESLRSETDLGALDAVIGVKGPVAPPDMCNGLALPIVIFDQLYWFDRESLLKSLPAHKGKETHASASELLDRILAATDNSGNSDEHRALNYLAVRYSGIYSLAAECQTRDLALTALAGRLWSLSTARRIVEIVFTFTQRKNEFVEKYCCRVDVNDEFPFLVSKIAPYYDH